MMPTPRRFLYTQQYTQQRIERVPSVGASWQRWLLVAFAVGIIWDLVLNWLLGKGVL
jgi:hypothetical protein